MRIINPALFLFVLGIPLVARADPERELRQAVDALTRTSYAWETTTRQRFSGETTDPRIDPNAPIGVAGKFESSGLMKITWQSGGGIGVPMTAVFQGGDVVVQTPSGWLRRTEIRAAPAADGPVEFAGKQIPRPKFFAAAIKTAELRPPTEDLFDVFAELKSCRIQDGLIIAELRDKMVEKLWGDRRAESAPEIQGTVICKLGEQGITECHYVVAIGFPNDRTQKIAWTMQQWSTRIKDIGATTVDAPEAAIEALNK